MLPNPKSFNITPPIVSYYSNSSFSILPDEKKDPMISRDTICSAYAQNPAIETLSSKGFIFPISSFQRKLKVNVNQVSYSGYFKLMNSKVEIV